MASKPPVDVACLSVKQLKKALTARGLSFADCFEKSDLRGKLQQAIDDGVKVKGKGPAAPAATPSGGGDDDPPSWPVVAPPAGEIVNMNGEVPNPQALGAWEIAGRQFFPVAAAEEAAFALNFVDTLDWLAAQDGIRLKRAVKEGGQAAFDRQRGQIMATEGNSGGPSGFTVLVLMRDNPLLQSELRRMNTGESPVDFPAGSARAKELGDLGLIRQMGCFYFGPVVTTLRRYETLWALQRFVDRVRGTPAVVAALRANPALMHDEALLVKNLVLV